MEQGNGAKSPEKGTFPRCHGVIRTMFHFHWLLFLGPKSQSPIWPPRPLRFISQPRGQTQARERNQYIKKRYLYQQDAIGAIVLSATYTLGGGRFHVPKSFFSSSTLVDSSGRARSAERSGGDIKKSKTHGAKILVLESGPKAGARWNKVIHEEFIAQTDTDKN